MKNNFESLEGKTVEEKYTSIGLREGKKINVLKLRDLSKKWGFEAVLYFEKDLVLNSTYEQDLKDHANVPEFDRPFVKAPAFLKFGAENDPTFEGRLTEFPLIVSISKLGVRTDENGESIPYLICMMPFLDEIDFDSEPGPIIG